jgi:hypothetical protein
MLEDLVRLSQMILSITIATVVLQHYGLLHSAQHALFNAQLCNSTTVQLYYPEIITYIQTALIQCTTLQFDNRSTLLSRNHYLYSNFFYFVIETKGKRRSFGVPCISMGNSITSFLNKLTFIADA